MSEVSQIAGRPSTVRLARISLWLFLIVAGVVGVITLVEGTLSLIASLTSGHIDLTLVADKHIPHGTDPGSAHIVSGSFASADLVLSNVSTHAMVFFIVATVAGTLTPVALCACIVLLAWRILRQRMFRRSFATTISTMGVIVTIGGLISQLALAIAAGTVATDLDGGVDGYWPIAGHFDPTFFAVGIVILLVGAAFEYGGRLQTETDGLV